TRTAVTAKPPARKIDRGGREHCGRFSIEHAIRAAPGLAFYRQLSTSTQRRCNDLLSARHLPAPSRSAERRQVLHYRRKSSAGGGRAGKRERGDYRSAKRSAAVLRQLQAIDCSVALWRWREGKDQPEHGLWPTGGGHFSGN